MRPRNLSSALLLCALAASPFARAEEPVVYGPDGAPTVVQRKLYTMTGRTEIGFAGEAALNTALVNQVGGLLSIAYHPNEWFDIGVDAMGNYTALSQLGRNIRADLSSTRQNAVKDEFANDNQLRAGLFATGRVAPIYGKLNLASEVKLHFQAFLLAGAGAVLVHRESVNLCSVAGTGPISTCNDFQSANSLPLAGEVGGGFRFYLNDAWSLRTELRSFLFRSTYKRENDLADPATGTPKAYLAAVTMLLVGVSRTF